MTTYTTTANADPHTITVVDDPDLVSITITETGVTLSLDPVEFTAAVTSVAGQIGAVTLDTDDVTEGSNLYYTDARTQAVIDTNSAGFITDYTVTQSDVTDHEAAIEITESQITDLQSYITGYTVTESDVTDHEAAIEITESQITDLQSYITDYTVTESDVTDHEAALEITESQITDLQSYITDYTVTESDVTDHEAALTITESQISDLDKYTNADFDTRLATKTTANLSEGSNLYYTDARANSAIDTRVTGSFIDALDTVSDGGTY